MDHGSTDMATVAEVRSVSKSFGPTRALREVSLDVRPGEIHALIGRNGAGKSTMVHVLTGLIAPDNGTVFLHGKPAPPPEAREKWRPLVGCVYQYPAVVPALSVAENLFLGNLPEHRGGAVDWQTMRRRAAESLGEWGIDVDVCAPAGHLSVDQRQIVEITRALLLGTHFIILDEPTAGLTTTEVDRLFERIRMLQASGVAFLYISHYLEEIFELCDRATILRDGRLVATNRVADLTRPAVIELMVGDKMAEAVEAPRARSTITSSVQTAPLPALEVRGVSVAPGCSVDFAVAGSEIVGLAGGPGSGNAEVADYLAGLMPALAGHAFIHGRPLMPGQPWTNVDRGLGYLPGDRYARGFVAEGSLADNVSLPILRRLSRFGFVSRRRREEIASRLVRLLDIKVDTVWQRLAELSGGNQQKATLARALASSPDSLVLVRPTAGIDIASKLTILNALRELSLGEGVAILVVSDDEEDLGICDRVLVMFRGRIVREFEPGWHSGELVSAMEGWTGHEQLS